MNSPLRLRLVQSSEELLQDYLDNLCAPLVGVVPYVERQSLRAEEHLLALIEDKEAQGLFSEAAVAAALIEYGEPYPLGQTLRETWCRGQMPRIRLARYTGADAVRAFAFFGAASVVNGLLVQVTALVPGWKGTTPYLFVLAVLLPLLAGAVTGATTPVRSVPAVLRALAVLIPHSFVAGLLARHLRRSRFLRLAPR